MAKFWWGDQTDAKKVHWIRWEKLCWIKKEGGIGYKDHTFNLAMSAKQGWRIMHHLELLVSRILKARYVPSGSFLNAHIRANPSYT